MDRKSRMLRKENWISENAVYWLAFFVPIFIMILIYLIRDIYPFGNQMYLRSDMYHQYAPFYQELANKLKNGDSLLYTWDVGMGMNFIGLAAYYLASPMNLILGFFTGEHIIEVMSSLIIFKMGLASLSVTWYLTKHFQTKSMFTAIFGICYALSSYYCAFSWNIMWLDCMALLPLILLGIERLVAEGKYKLYCISLGLAIFSNYYIAIMLCIFSVIYFIYSYLVYPGKKDWRFMLNRGVRFGLFSLLSGGMAACLVLPEYNALMLTASGEFDFPDQLGNYFSVMDMLSRSLMNVDVSIFEPHDPNLYCSILVFLLMPLYWLSKKIRLSEKIGKTVILAIFLFSFNMNIPDYIWHGFHFPNSLACRESFIYIFMVLVMSYEALHHIKEFSNREMYGAFAVSAALFFLLEELYVSEDYSFSIIYVSFVFLALYLMILCTYRHPRAKKGMMMYLLFVIVVAECVVNANETGFSTTGRDYYLTDNAAIETLKGAAEQDAAGDTLFYRMEKYERRTKNDQAWHQYRGMSTFSSTAVKAVGDYYNELGLQQSYNAYAFYGATPLTSAMFSVRYVLSNEERDSYPTEELLAQEAVNSESSVYLYKNRYTLPIGFMLDREAAEEWEEEIGNPFVIQNKFAEYTADVYDLFTPLMTEESGDQIEISVEEDSDVYFYVYTSNVEKTVAAIYDEEGNYVGGETFTNTNHKYICHLGNVAEGYSVELTGKDEDGDDMSLMVYAYSFDSDKMERVYEKLNRGGLELTSFEDTFLEGTVTAEEDGLLYLSISYEDGWTALVDGKEVETVPVHEAMLGVPVSAGTHKVSLRYSPAGFQLGLIISISSICLFILIAIGEFVWRRTHVESAPYQTGKPLRDADEILAEAETEMKRGLEEIPNAVRYSGAEPEEDFPLPDLGDLEDLDGPPDLEEPDE